MSTPNTSHRDSQPETSFGAASTDGLLVIEEKIKISRKTLLDFGSSTMTDEDVVCSQIDRDEFKAFVKEQGESDLGKTTRLIDYIMAKEIYESSQAGLVKGTAMEGVTIQETATLVMDIRNTTSALLESSEAAWELFLDSLRQYGVACSCNNEMEALIESLGGMVPMDVWDQIWKQFMAALGVDAFHASTVMATNLLDFIDGKNSGEKGNRAILVLLPDWTKEWMEKTLKE